MFDLEASVAGDFGGDHVDFGGNVSAFVEDNSGPAGATGKIVKGNKSRGAETYGLAQQSQHSQTENLYHLVTQK